MLSPLQEADDALRRAIETVLAGVDVAGLRDASRRLSERYRDARTGDGKRLALAAPEYHAYVAARLPATFAALTSVLLAIRSHVVDWSPLSQLDLGAGTGAAAWAASPVWPEIRQVTLVDRDETMIRLGRRLRSADRRSPEATWDWVRDDLATSRPGPHDLTTIAYTLGELSPDQALSVARTAWAATRGVLVIVEPGTPRGFGVIRRVRSTLIEDGGQLVAPCPHARECPIVGDDWCHFAVRLQRSALHRHVKEVDLSYEDEKYSYVAFARTHATRATARVLRHPDRPPRRIQLVACTETGLRTITIGKSHPAYKQAKDLRWGSEVPPEALS